MPDIVFVKSVAFSIGEISYSIGLYHSDEGYIAFCDCHNCENHNMRSKPTADEEAAVKECEELIQGHHGDCHGPACASG